MSDPRYPSGEEIHAGDRLTIGGESARVMFVTQRREYASGISADDWAFVRGDTIALEFDDGRVVMFDGFCSHDRIVLRSRA